MSYFLSLLKAGETFNIVKNHLQFLRIKGSFRCSGNERGEKIHFIETLEIQKRRILTDLLHLTS